MKYIKVENKIRVVLWETDDRFAIESALKDEYFLINKKYVDKAADSIVDLFDKIILITAPSFGGSAWHNIYSDKLTGVQVFKEDQRKDKFSRDFSRCLGAVWTDDGLRYAAEYKDGEWELL